MQLLKRQLQAGRFGQPVCGGEIVRAAAAEPLLIRYWRGTWEFDGGALMNQVSHYVDSGLASGTYEQFDCHPGPPDRGKTPQPQLRWRNGAWGPWQ